MGQVYFLYVSVSVACAAVAKVAHSKKRIGIS
jgi:hypothetical protein